MRKREWVKNINNNNRRKKKKIENWKLRHVFKTYLYLIVGLCVVKRTFSKVFFLFFPLIPFMHFAVVSLVLCLLHNMCVNNLNSFFQFTWETKKKQKKKKSKLFFCSYPRPVSKGDVKHSLLLDTLPVLFFFYHSVYMLLIASFVCLHLLSWFSCCCIL